MARSRTISTVIPPTRAIIASMKGSTGSRIFSITLSTSLRVFLNGLAKSLSKPFEASLIFSLYQERKPGSILFASRQETNPDFLSGGECIFLPLLCCQRTTPFSNPQIFMGSKKKGEEVMIQNMPKFLYRKPLSLRV